MRFTNELPPGIADQRKRAQHPRDTQQGQVNPDENLKQLAKRKGALDGQLAPPRQRGQAQPRGPYAISNSAASLLEGYLGVFDSWEERNKQNKTTGRVFTRCYGGVTLIADRGLFSTDFQVDFNDQRGRSPVP